MNISECHDFLEFWINKYEGGYYSPQEIDEVIDRGQMSLYADIQPKYATSQHIKDALSPFRAIYSFGNNDSILGIITIPASANFLNLLDCTIVYDISARSITKQVPINMVNEDVRAIRLDSQIDPVTATSPIGEIIGYGVIQLYPKFQYVGNTTFLRRPVKPSFQYSVISGRVIVYDPINSVQLEWSENWQNAVLMKALESIGINLSAQDLLQWSEMKNQQNFQGENRT